MKIKIANLEQELTTLKLQVADDRVVISNQARKIGELDFEVARRKEIMDRAVKIITPIREVVSHAHHAGAWRWKDTNNRELGIVGTLRGALGIVPYDTDVAHLVTYHMRDNRGPFTLTTYGWDMLFENQQLWKTIMDRVWVDQLPFSQRDYPQLDFPAIVGYHYDPDPPSPSLHQSGLQLELNYWKTDSVLFPHIEEQKEKMSEVLRSWFSRVMPMVTGLEELVDLAWF